MIPPPRPDLKKYLAEATARILLTGEIARLNRETIPTNLRQSVSPPPFRTPGQMEWRGRARSVDQRLAGVERKALKGPRLKREKRELLGL